MRIVLPAKDRLVKTPQVRNEEHREERELEEETGEAMSFDGNGTMEGPSSPFILGKRGGSLSSTNNKFYS